MKNFGINLNNVMKKVQDINKPEVAIHTIGANARLSLEESFIDVLKEGVFGAGRKLYYEMKSRFN